VIPTTLARVAPYVAQVCDPDKTMVDYISNAEFIKALSCPYFNTAGMLVTGMFVYGAISSVIYLRTDSVMIPFVLLLLTGGAITTQLAGPGMAIATILLLTVGAGVLTVLYRRYSR
jgi:hypothetical protein